MRSLAGLSRKPLLALLALFFAVSAAPLSSGPAVAGSKDIKGGTSPLDRSSGRDAAREQDRRMNDWEGDDGSDGGGGGGGGGSH